MILVVDNYDSFTYNLVQYLGELGADLRVLRNDAADADAIAAMAPERIVISPGPGHPGEAGVSLDVPADLSLLDAEELALVKAAAQYPRVVEGAAMAHEPHRIAFYLYDLAAEFHALWNRGNDDPSRRFLLENNPQLSRARLELARGIGQIIRNGLKIMGVEAVEEMR